MRTREHGIDVRLALRAATATKARFVASIVLLFWVGACSRSFDALPRPVFFDTGPMNSNCGSTTAIDANGGVWTESGCEGRSTEVRKRDSLSDAKKARFDLALAAVRRTPAVPASGARCKDHRGMTYLLKLAEADGTSREWWVCVEEGVWPPPYDAVFATMQ